MSQGITAIKVDDQPDGRFMRVRLEWTDEAGERREALFCGLSGDRVSTELADATAINEDRRAGYLLGLARGVTAAERR